MKKTAPYALTFAFLVGYFVSNIVTNVDFEIISKANAEVAGMGYNELKSDRDFEKAVKRVVEDSCRSGGVFDTINCL